MKKIELKPCPFCGGQGRLLKKTVCAGMGCYPTKVFVACQNCGASGGEADSYFDGDDEALLSLIAIDKWERRTDDEQAKA